MPFNLKMRASEAFEGIRCQAKRENYQLPKVNTQQTKDFCIFATVFNEGTCLKMKN